MTRHPGHTDTPAARPVRPADRIIAWPKNRGLTRCEFRAIAATLPDATTRQSSPTSPHRGGIDPERKGNARIAPSQAARAAGDGGDGDRPRARRHRYCCLRRPSKRRLPGQQRSGQRHRPGAGRRRVGRRRRIAVAGGLRVPWATFEQKTAGVAADLRSRLQERAVGDAGQPGVAEHRPDQEAEAPSIDFAGADRTVPWVSWYEPNRPHRQPDADLRQPLQRRGQRWVPEGQDRVPGSKVPSLNINVDRKAENPAVVGGAAVAGQRPVPWVAWQENDGGPTDAAAQRQIFVSERRQAGAGGPAVHRLQARRGTPRSASSAGSRSVSTAWPRTASRPMQRAIPSLNIDPSRDGVEPDIAFTGPNDTVPWVVWYEKKPSHLGLDNNERCSPPRRSATPAPTAASTGGGRQRHRRADERARHARRHRRVRCLRESQRPRTRARSTRTPRVDAEDPRVAAGTLAPGGRRCRGSSGPRTSAAGRHGIFVSRLVGGDHFELVNGGQPMSNPLNDASQPDITFSGNTPYITWQETSRVAARLLRPLRRRRGQSVLQARHADRRSSTRRAAADLRAPISSSCTANPFNADGQACPAGAIGTPFFLFTEGTRGSQKLFAKAYAPGDIATGRRRP